MTKQKKRKKQTKKQAKKQPAKEPAAEPKPAPSPTITPHPTAGRKITDFEERLDEAMASESAETPKRGRGRPRKQPEPAEPAEPEPQAISLDILVPVIKIPFDLWAAGQKEDRLKITDREAATIAEPLFILLDYYLPKIPTIAYAWISLAVVSYTVFQPRLELIQQIKKQSSPSSAAPSAAGSQDGKKPAMDARPLRSATVQNKESQDFPTEIKTERV